MSEAVVIPLDRIIPDPKYQPRDGGLSASHIRLLMESDPTTWPPSIVSPDGKGEYDIIDGFHRYEAGARLGLTHLPCVVWEGAGYPEAVAANIAHGLPLSRADRKQAARWWASTEPGLSHREIGRRVGLSDKTVAKAITSRTTEPSQSRQTADPLDRWFFKTAQLDRMPSTRDVSREIATYEKEDRSGIAKVYAAIGRALTEASTPYLKGR